MIQSLTPKIFIIIIISALLTSSCINEMEKDKAMSHLKAFDNELVRLIRDIQRTEAFSSFSMISSINKAPLPFVKDEDRIIPGVAYSYDFDYLKGIYELDTLNMVFEKTGNSDSVIVYFKNPSLNNASVKLIIADYEEKPTSSAFFMPSEIDMKMFIDNIEVMSIKHHADVQYGYPFELSFYGYFNGYIITSELNTSLRRKTALANWNLSVFNNEERIANWKLNAVLNHEAVVYFEEDYAVYNIKKLSMLYEMYPIKIDVEVNNEAIPVFTNDYVSEFNKHSNIRVFSFNTGKKIGDVKLLTKERSDKLDYVIYFKDGSYLYIEDLLLSARRILNIKT